MTKEELKASGHHKRVGLLGGLATKKKMIKKNINYYSENGLKGSKKLAERFHSPEEMKAYFSEIGKLSGQRRLDKEAT